MKYVCEICGCSFDTPEECEKHETKCSTDNARNLYIRDQFNELLSAAIAGNARFGVVVPMSDGSNEWFDMQPAQYIHAKNTIAVVLVAPIVEEGGENKAKGSGKKSK